MIRPEYLTARFRELIRQAGLPPIRLHDLRHTSASLALAAGVPLKVVSDRLGHSTIGITADPALVSATITSIMSPATLSGCIWKPARRPPTICWSSSATSTATTCTSTSTRRT